MSNLPGSPPGHPLAFPKNPPWAHSIPLRRVMAKDYGQLWKDVTHAIDEVQAVQTLAEILADKEGGTFISRLDNKDAELCIEILDCVSRDLYMPFATSDGLARVSQCMISNP